MELEDGRMHAQSPAEVMKHTEYEWMQGADAKAFVYRIRLSLQVQNDHVILQLICQ